MEKITVPKPKRLKKYSIIILVTGLILGSAWFAGFNIAEVFLKLYKGGRLLGRMFLPPNFSYIPKIVNPMLQTIQMAIVGTFIGALVALPTAVLAANNFIKTKWLHIPLRVILNIFRTIPAMVLASLFVAIFGLGAFSGVVALAIFTFGLISKLTFETIEAIDYGQVEALMSLGANKMNVLRYAIMPQILPQFLSYTIYGFEVNIRAAAVLGWVGAGGIGQTLETNLAWRNFDNVGMIIIFSFVIVLIIDLISSAIRKRLV
ncbi:MAG: phosphonate ABC transporter, permease protein PhnE [Clostridia bacterium]|nr:phosphonate ABC transporter, permease protein PhnE [Clostridia bacterium]